MLLYHSVIFPASSRFFEYRGAATSHGKMALFRFPFFSTHKGILFQKSFHEASCFTPKPNGGGEILLLSFYTAAGCCLRIFLCACACPLWFRSRLGRQVDQCVVVLGVSDSLAIGWVTWLHLNPSGPLIPKEWFRHSECFNWFFCDLESTFQIRRHAIKDY